MKQPTISLPAPFDHGVTVRGHDTAGITEAWRDLPERGHLVVQARLAGLSKSAVIVSPSRSRSKIRERPSVPEKTIATHRIPPATSWRGALTAEKAKEKITTTSTEKSTMV